MRERQPLVHAEAVLLVDDRQSQIAERDIFLKQRMGADDEVDIAGGEACQNVVALAAALAPGEDGEPQSDSLGERRDGGEMLPRQDFSRRHERRLPAGFDHMRCGKERHHRLARTDVAVEEPQHALRLRQIGDDVGDRADLRRSKRIGQRVDDARAQQTFGGAAAAGAGSHVCAKERQRQLACQQFVISEPRPCGARRLDVLRRGGAMQHAQRVGKAWIIVTLEPGRILPFRQRRQPLEREIHCLAQLVRVQPLGQRIDRIDQRQAGKSRGVDHAVGMHHLQMAVIERGGARHVAQRAFGILLFQIIPARVEIGDHQRIGVIGGVDIVRRPRPVRRRRPMPVDGDRNRHHGVGNDLGQFRLVAPVDKAGRQVKQQIDHPRPLAVARQELAEQLFQLRPDAGQRRQRGKERIEDRWAHELILYRHHPRKRMIQ